MANSNLDLPPQQSASGGAPGVNQSALNRLQQTRLPAPPAVSQRSTAMGRLAHAIARLPGSGPGKAGSQLFLP